LMSIGRFGDLMALVSVKQVPPFGLVSGKFSFPLSKCRMHKDSIENKLEDSFEKDLELLHNIYPNLSPTQLLEAKENLDRYFDLAVRIFLRLEKEEAEKKRSENNQKDF